MKRTRKNLLRKIEEKKIVEKKNRSELAAIERSFYQEVMNEIEEMQIEMITLSKKERMNEAMRLNLELDKIRKSLDELIHLRIRKILMFSTWEDGEIKNMTNEEMILYSDLKNAVIAFENTVLRKTEKSEDSGAEMYSSSSIQQPSEIKNEDIMIEKSKGERKIFARVIAPTGRIALPGDRVLNLKKEDILYLPEKIFNILVKRDKVEEIRILRKNV